MALGSLLLQPCHPEGLDGELPASASFSPVKGAPEPCEPSVLQFAGHFEKNGENLHFSKYQSYYMAQN